MADKGINYHYPIFETVHAAIGSDRELAVVLAYRPLDKGDLTYTVYYIQSKILGTVRATDISENVGGIALPAHSSTLSLYEYKYSTYSFSDYINDFGQEDFSVFEIVRGLLDSGEALTGPRANLDKGISSLTDIEQTAFETADRVRAYKVTSEYLNYVEPKTYTEAKSFSDFPFWEKATKAEVDQMISFKVLRMLKELPEGVIAVGTRFVFKLKLNADGTIERYEARLVALGYAQRYGVDFVENFSPTLQLSTLRFICAIAVQYGLSMRTADVKAAFLNSKLATPIYVKLPDGFTIDGCQYGVLEKSLYGLKQASRDWYFTLRNWLMKFDPRLKRSVTEPCMFHIWTADLKFLLLVFVDDIIVVTDSVQYYDKFIVEFKKTFDCTDKGVPVLLLGMSITVSKDSIEFSQERTIAKASEKYLEKNLSKTFKTPMEHKVSLYDGNKEKLPDVPYRNLIGTLYWIARTGRPDVLLAVNWLARLVSCFTFQHWLYAKRILKYLLDTKVLTLKYSKQDFDPEKLSMNIYVDANHNKDPDMFKGRSTSAAFTCIFGNLIDWSVEKQDFTAQSSTEAEIYAITTGINDGLYFTHLIEEIGLPSVQPHNLYVDNTGAGQTAEQPMNNKRSKHIHFKNMVVRDYIEKGMFELFHIAGTQNPADIGTKPLTEKEHWKHVATLLNLSAEQVSALLAEI